MSTARVVAAAVLLGWGAFAETPPEVLHREAEADFRAATRLFDEGDLEGAVARYRLAFAKEANARSLGNLAVALDRLGRSAEAAEAFERYLAGDLPGFNPAWARSAQDALWRLQRRLGRMRILVNEEGAEVAVDGEPFGHSPLGRDKYFLPGLHRVEANKDGFGTHTREVVVEEGKATHIQLTLREAARVANPPPMVEIASPPAAMPASRAEQTPVVVVRSEVPDRGHVGLAVRGEVEARRGGVGPSAGAFLLLGRRVELSALALFRRDIGARAACSVFLLPDATLRPFAKVAVPVFFADGARPGFGGGIGVAWDLARHFALVADASAEHFPDVPDGYQQTSVLFGLGAEARY